MRPSGSSTRPSDSTRGAPLPQATAGVCWCCKGEWARAVLDLSEAIERELLGKGQGAGPATDPHKADEPDPLVAAFGYRGRAWAELGEHEKALKKTSTESASTRSEECRSDPV